MYCKRKLEGICNTCLTHACMISKLICLQSKLLSCKEVQSLQNEAVSLTRQGHCALWTHTPFIACIIYWLRMVFTFSGCGVQYTMCMYGRVFVPVLENAWRRMKTTGSPHFYVRMIWKVAQEIYVASSVTWLRKERRRDFRYPPVPYVNCAYG